MSRMNSDISTVVSSRRWLPWATMIGGLVSGIAIGVLTDKSFFVTATEPKATANFGLSQPIAVPEAVTFEIVPASLIETRRQIFFGTGDGSAGYYSERPEK